MNDEFTPVEVFIDKAASHIKWTTSLSIFFITALLTIVTLKENLSSTTAIILIIVLLPMIINVFFGWKIANECFKLQRIIFDNRVLSIEDIKQNEYKNMIKDSSGKIESFVKWHYITFFIGFIAFIIFIMGYMYIEKYFGNYSIVELIRSVLFLFDRIRRYFV